MTKQWEELNEVKCQNGTKGENRIVGVMLGESNNERKRDEETVKWSRAIRAIEGMKVRDGEHKIMEGGREIEKGTLGSRSKSVWEREGESLRKCVLSCEMRPLSAHGKRRREGREDKRRGLCRQWGGGESRALFFLSHTLRLSLTTFPG